MKKNNSKTNRLKLLLFIFFSFPLIIECQNSQFIEALNYKQSANINGLSNNPYTLITSCFFNKTINDEIIWGSSRVSDNYHFTMLDTKEYKITDLNIDFNAFKNKIPKRDYEQLMFYGFSSVIKTKLFVAVTVGNVIFFFKGDGSSLSYIRTEYIEESIEFSNCFANTDSTLILLDYRATYEGEAKIKAFSYNFRTSYINQVFEQPMSSNSACFDRTSTRFYDSNKHYFLITDNLEYKIYLFDNIGNELFGYEKPLSISELSKHLLNPSKKVTGGFDSIVNELKLTSRILNTQFLNDSDIIVSYCVKPVLEKNGISIKNSMIDLLTIRKDKIVFKKTYDDTYLYEQLEFKKTGRINQSMFNPSVRNSLFYFFSGNFLINFDFKQMIPKSNTTFSKFIRKAKFSVLSLKSNLVFSVYEFKY